MRFRVPILLLGLSALLPGCRDDQLTAPQEVRYNHSPGHGGGGDQEAGSYALLTLDTRWSQTTGINDAGTIVGRKAATDVWHAALWQDGVAITLPTARTSFAGINNQGVAIGWESDDINLVGIHRRGFIYRNGEVVPISGDHLDEYEGDVFFTGSLDDDRVQPRDINDHGTVIAHGMFTRPDGWLRRYAFAWREGSAITYIRGGQPTSINNHGQMVGWAWYTIDPVVWEAGSYDDPRVVAGLRDHFPDQEIELQSINDSGQILGLACKRTDGRHFCGGGAYELRGFVLDGGTVVQLPLPSRTLELGSVGGLDQNGRVVGMVTKREGGSTNQVPVLWTLNAAGATVQELPRGDYTQASAIAINGHGQIAGHANPWEALLWTPVSGDDSGGDDSGGGDGGECTHPKGKCK
jgi:uncharacterized membrane protein